MRVFCLAIDIQPEKPEHTPAECTRILIACIQDPDEAIITRTFKGFGIGKVSATAASKEQEVVPFPNQGFRFGIGGSRDCRRRPATHTKYPATHTKYNQQCNLILHTNRQKFTVANPVHADLPMPLPESLHRRTPDLPPHRQSKRNSCHFCKGFE